MLSIVTGQPKLFSFDWLRDGGVKVGVVLALAVLISRIGTLTVRRVRRRLEGSPSATVAMDLHRVATLTTTLANAIRVIVWTIVLLTVLGQLGINLAPLLAGAGIAGLALGFGAQSLVKDFLAGFFVLLENQYGVGDAVEIAIAGATPVSGRVETVTLRSTAVRASDGTLAVTGNGSIVTVKNQSRGSGRLTVDVRIPGRQDASTVERRLEEVVQELREDPSLQRFLSDGPNPVGVEPTGGDDLLVTVAAETRPSRRAEVEHELRRKLNRKLLPFPQQVGDDGDAIEDGPER